jgi:hypothetical protein
MKTIMLGLIGWIIAFQLQAQLVTFTFTGASGNEVSFAPDQPLLGAAVSPMMRGPGLTLASGADTFNASAWSTGARDANDYFTFSLTPDPGMRMTLTGLALDERRSLTGIREWCVRSNLDGFGTDLSLFAVPDNAETRLGQTTLLGSAFANLTGTVEFRLYGYGAETTAGTWRMDQVALDGSISAVPEPSEYAMVFGLGLMVFALGERVCLGKARPTSITYPQNATTAVRESSGAN